jgi:exonuclease III
MWLASVPNGMVETNYDYSLLSWNVHGLNNTAKQEDVKQVVQIHKPMVVCLQETKLSNINAQLVTIIMGSAYNTNFMFFPADGTRGGILLACKDIPYQFFDVLFGLNESN